jgi:hypothetical protein
MFHQVRLREEDQDDVCFIWGEDVTQGVSHYKMMVHIFGATCSPCCASFALKKTARDNADDFTSETIKTVENGCRNCCTKKDC